MEIERKYFVVINTPWPVDLPNGTIIEKVSSEDSKGRHTFKRVGVEGAFLDSQDGSFKLFRSEFIASAYPGPAE